MTDGLGRIRHAAASASASAVLCALIGAGAVGVSGCSLGEIFRGDRVDPEVPLWVHRPNGAMHVVIHRELTAPGRVNGEPWEGGRPEIDTTHGRVFVGSSDHGLYALRAADGSTIWRFETLGAVQCEPLYDPASDVVYFGSNDGALYALRAHDGKLIFRFDSGAEVAKRPVFAGGAIVFVNAADHTFAIDPDTGKRIWEARGTSALAMEIAGHAGPAYDEGLDRVFTAYSDGHVVAYAARDGAEKWAVDLSAEAEQAAGEVPRYLDADTTPVLFDLPQGRVLFVSTYAGGVYALAAATGAQLWSNDKALGVTNLVLWQEPAHRPNPHGPDRGGPMVPARALLIASSATTGLQALDPKNGQLRWRNKLPEGGVTPAVPFAGGLLVGTTRYGLFLLSPTREGRVIDGLDLGTGFAMTPAAAAGHAYVMSNAGTFIGVTVTPPLGPRAARAARRDGGLRLR